MKEKKSEGKAQAKGDGSTRAEDGQGRQGHLGQLEELAALHEVQEQEVERHDEEQ